MKNLGKKIEDYIPFIGTDKLVSLKISPTIDRDAKVVGIDIEKNQLKVIVVGETNTNWFALYFENEGKKFYYITIKPETPPVPLTFREQVIEIISNNCEDQYTYLKHFPVERMYGNKVNIYELTDELIAFFKKNQQK